MDLPHTHTRDIRLKDTRSAKGARTPHNAVMMTGTGRNGEERGGGGGGGETLVAMRAHSAGPSKGMNSGGKATEYALNKAWAGELGVPVLPGAPLVGVQRDDGDLVVLHRGLGGCGRTGGPHACVRASRSASQLGTAPPGDDTSRAPTRKGCGWGVQACPCAYSPPPPPSPIPPWSIPTYAAEGSLATPHDGCEPVRLFRRDNAPKLYPLQFSARKLRCV